MLEPVEARLARIEEGMQSLHHKVDHYHRSIEKKLDKIDDHETDIAVMKHGAKNNRWWITGIAAVFGSAFAIAVEKLLK